MGSGAVDIDLSEEVADEVAERPARRARLGAAGAGASGGTGPSEVIVIED